MSQTAATSDCLPTAEEISLRDVLQVLWRSKLLICSVTFFCAVAAGAAAWLMPKQYQASVVMSAVSSSSGSGQLGALSSLATQFGGLASLAGLSVSGDSKKVESVAVLQSEALTEQYIQQNNLLPVLYERKWNAAAKTWTEADPTKVPTLWKANQDFKNKIRSVTTEAKTGLVTLTITWTDPQLAARWANDLVKAANEFLRNQAIQESERNIAYLNAQAAKTDAVGVKEAIYTILQSEIDKAMLARGSDQYALKVIDPAVAPERSSFPKPILWLAMGFLLGFLLAVIVAFVRSGSRERTSRT